MLESEEHKELSRVPRPLGEAYNGENLDMLLESGGTIMSDIIIYAGRAQMKDLFGDTWFSMEDFCKTMGYTRTRLQKKLTEEQKKSTFGANNPIYYTYCDGEKIEHPIETVFESALYSLGKNTLSVAYNHSGVTKYKFIQILESFEIKDNFLTQKKTKRMYKVNLSKDLMHTLFNGYNLIDLKDYRSLPNRKGYRKFYLNLAKMIYLIKYKVQNGSKPEFIVTVDDLAKCFEVNITNNHDRKKKVATILNAIIKNLDKTKFSYEFVKREGEKWAYSIRFMFADETLEYFDERVKAIISSQFYEGLKQLYLKKIGVQTPSMYKYEDALNFGTGEMFEEFNQWLYGEEDKQDKIDVYISTYIKVLKTAPKEKIINLTDIL